MHINFENRRHAGRILATYLSEYANREDVTILALPRGGVPVAYEVAIALQAELDVLVVRKLGVPTQPELAMGAIASGDAFYLDESIVNYAGVTQEQLEKVITNERAELERREALYRGERAPLNLSDRVAIIVDDGMATGASMLVAAMSLRHARPSRLVAALPVAPEASESRIEHTVDEFVCVLRPRHFFGVGQFYDDFEHTSDEEVRSLLETARLKPN